MKKAKSVFTPHGIIRACLKEIPESLVPAYHRFLQRRYSGGIPVFAVVNDYPEFEKTV